MGVVKRRRTHGYAIFSSEMRKKMGDAIPLSETTRVIAEKWRNADGPTRQDYERRAAKGIFGRRDLLNETFIYFKLSTNFWYNDITLNKFKVFFIK